MIFQALEVRLSGQQFPGPPSYSFLRWVQCFPLSSHLGLHLTDMTFLNTIDICTAEEPVILIFRCDDMKQDV